MLVSIRYPWQGNACGRVIPEKQIKNFIDVGGNSARSVRFQEALDDFSDDSHTDKSWVEQTSSTPLVLRQDPQELFREKKRHFYLSFNTAQRQWKIIVLSSFARFRRCRLGAYASTHISVIGSEILCYDRRVMSTFAQRVYDLAKQRFAAGLLPTRSFMFLEDLKNPDSPVSCSIASSAVHNETQAFDISMSESVKSSPFYIHGLEESLFSSMLGEIYTYVRALPMDVSWNTHQITRLFDAHKALIHMNMMATDIHLHKVRRCMKAIAKATFNHLVEEFYSANFQQDRSKKHYYNLEEIFYSRGLFVYYQDRKSKHAEYEDERTLLKNIRKVAQRLLIPYRHRSSFVPNWLTGTSSTTLAAISESVRELRVEQAALLPAGMAVNISAPMTGEWEPLALGDSGVSQLYLSGVRKSDYEVAVDYALYSATKTENELNSLEVLKSILCIETEMRDIFAPRLMIELHAYRAIFQGKGLENVQAVIQRLENPNQLMERCLPPWKLVRRWFGNQIPAEHYGFSFAKSTNLIRCFPRGTLVGIKQNGEMRGAIYLSCGSIPGMLSLAVLKKGRLDMQDYAFDEVYPLYDFQDSRCWNSLLKNAPRQVGLEHTQETVLAKLTISFKEWKKNLLLSLENRDEVRWTDFERTCLEENFPVVFAASSIKNGKLEPVISRLTSLRGVNYRDSAQEAAWFADAKLGSDINWLISDDEHAKKLARFCSQHNLIFWSFQELAFRMFIENSGQSRLIDFMQDIQDFCDESMQVQSQANTKKCWDETCEFTEQDISLSLPGLSGPSF